MRAYQFILAHLPRDIVSLLDIGFGGGEVAYLVRADPDFHIKKIVGVEAFKPFVNFVEKHHIYDEVYHATIESHLPFRDKEFDVLILSQMLDHLKPSDANDILQEAERVAKKLIIIVADNVDHDGQTEFLNPYQRHLSNWKASDFNRLGYTVYGIGAFRYPLPHALARFAEIAVRRVPSLSRHILAVKELDGIK